MNGRSTLEHVAEQAGVSVSTASRALRGDPRISQSTRLRIEAEARRLAYHKSKAPVYLADGGQSKEYQSTLKHLKALGVVADAPHLRDFYADVFAELSQLGQSQAFLLRTYVGSGDQSLSALVKECQTGVDGIIVCTWKNLVPADVVELQAMQVPVILINRYIEGYTNSVTLDDFAAGVKAARYLLGLGHRRIAHLPGPRTSSSLRDRANGFQIGLESAGCYSPELFAPPVSGDLLEWARLCTAQLLTLEDPPTAIWAYCDIAATVAMVTARSAGMQVPEDISIMGFDQTPHLVDTGLTTFSHRCRELAHYAHTLLTGLLSGTLKGPVRVCVMPELIEGKTTSQAPRT